MMKLVEYPLGTPEELVALDELLLRKAEDGEIGETLRFWEAGEYFIVIGRSSRVEEDCFKENCLADGIKIVRRISGGGTVLQGPGCVNFSMVVSYKRDKAMESIGGSYRALLGKVAHALGEEGVPSVFEPISDLSVYGRKISGNAQARKKNYFLHHGTFLTALSLGKVSRWIKLPSVEPRYREGRTHEEFMRNTGLAAARFERAVIKAMKVDPSDLFIPTPAMVEELRKLVDMKYSKVEWNFVF